MDQITLGLDPLPKKTRKEVFLDEMNLVVPWGELVKLIQPHARGAHQARDQEAGVVHSSESACKRSASAVSSSAGEATTWQKSIARRRSTFSNSIRRGRSVTHSCGAFVTTTGSVSQANTMQHNKHHASTFQSVHHAAGQQPYSLKGHSN